MNKRRMSILSYRGYSWQVGGRVGEAEGHRRGGLGQIRLWLRGGDGRVQVVCAGGQAEEDEEEISASHWRGECYELRSGVAMHGEVECYAFEIECYVLGSGVLCIVDGWSS